MSSTQHKQPPPKHDPEKQWAVHGSHVVPVGDLRPHTVSDCWCDPIDDEGVTVHKSLDRRELYERGEIKPS